MTAASNASGATRRASDDWPFKLACLNDHLASDPVDLIIQIERTFQEFVQQSGQPPTTTLVRSRGAWCFQ